MPLGTTRQVTRCDDDEIDDFQRRHACEVRETRWWRVAFFVLGLSIAVGTWRAAYWAQETCENLAIKVKVAEVYPKKGG